VKVLAKLGKLLYRIASTLTSIPNRNIQSISGSLESV